MENIKNKVIISIDPDLHKNGYALYQMGSFGCVTSVNMWELFKCLEAAKWCEDNTGDDLTVLLEYPENTNTYHKGGKGAALNVGKNQAVAIIIKEFLEAKNIKHKLLFPKGYSNFFKDEKFFKLQTKWTERTNQDARAAAAMIWLNK